MNENIPINYQGNYRSSITGKQPLANTGINHNITSESGLWGIQKPLFGIGRGIDSIPPPQPMLPATHHNDGSPFSSMSMKNSGLKIRDNNLYYEDEHPKSQHSDTQAFSMRNYSPFIPRNNVEPQRKIADGVIADTIMGDEESTSEQVVADIKQQLETLICAVVLTSPNPKEVLDSSVLQGADAIEVSHRLMTRMKMLRDENKRLYKLANGTSLAQMEATIARLEKENASLKQMIQNN